jgi:hypothetical protein
MSARFRVIVALFFLIVAGFQPAAVHAQIKGKLANPAMTPPWDKGIQAINRDNYYNAIACGKRGGDREPCVFYDAGLCKSDDFELTLFTPYKQVAYEVWQTVRRKQPAPTPDYGAAQRTRITVGVTPVAGSKNPVTALTIKRGGKEIKPATQSVDDSGGRFIYDFAVFAPTEDITIDFIGRARTQSCLLDQSVLSKLR